jgi:phosphodiesterase/alkaline phosphatase D-like protein
LKPTTRRELIAAASVAGAMAAVPPAWAARLLSTRVGMGPGSFHDGVASGEPSATAVTFWSRLDTTHLRSGARLIVAKDEGLRNTVAHTVVPTGSSINGTLKARIGGLKPSTEYFYAWESGTHHSPVGRTRTFPHPTSRQPLRIGFSSCQHYTYGYFSAHTAAAADDLDIYAFLGDYIYDRGRAPHPAEPRQDTSSSTDLRSYRRKYARYRSDSGLRELHRVQPIIHVWDDHEVENNYSDGRTLVEPLQRAAAYRASFEWMPRMALPSDRFRIYKRIPMGLTADLFMLDERQYRTVDSGGQPGQILGEAQMRWLIDGLKASKARWKVIVQQVTVAPMDFGNGESQDSWGGYDSSRTRLLGEIERAGIQNVVFLTGDAHVFMLNLLASDHEAFRSDPQHPAAAIEYVGGSVTSPGGARDEASVQSRNPWNREFNSEQHGYAHMAADSTQLVTEYRRSDIGSPQGATSPFERFTQPSGTNTVSRESIPAPVPPPPPPDPESPGAART